MNWEQIKEGIWAAAALAFLVKFWMLHGQVTEFFNNHFPHFVERFDALHKKVDDNSEGIARLEGRK
ncbi:hypothetical protein LCGC14_2292900 [marine sediment metagenome]|uniref:Uncharacterized protein n=2 Tax=marine sediment metagenome TaxID=412755 RepID=A0A0F9CRA5_9ZZZZ